MMVESTRMCLEGRIKELEAETREMRSYELAKDRVIAQLRGRIAKLEAQIAERALQSACMELDIRNIISVEVSEAIEPARDKTIKLCDRTMTIKMRDGRIFKVVTYYDDQYSVSISADRRTMKINASAIVYPGSRLATNDKERK